MPVGVHPRSRSVGVGGADEPVHVRPAGPVEQQGHRDGDTDDQPGQGVEDEHAEHRGDGGEEVHAGGGAVDAAEPLGPDPVEPAQGGDVDQLDDRGDHDGGQGGLRQLFEQAGQEQQREHGERGDREPADLGAGAGAAVDGGLGQAAVDDHPGGQTGAEVRHAETGQLAVGVDVVARPGGVRLRRRQPFGEPDQQHPGGRPHQGEVVVHPQPGGEAQGRQAGLDRPDDRHAALVEVQHGDGGDAEQDRHQRPRHER